MNKNFTLYFLFIFTLFISGSAYAACPTGDITLSSQADVDNFATDYPGCNEVPDGVEITIEGSGITNLDGLSVLMTVNGDLEIQNCPDLISIAGLSGITTCNPQGEIEISNCDMLLSLNGLHNLTTCHDLEIKNCALLNDLTALSNLTTVTGELKIKNNASLTSLDGLQNITSIGGGPDTDGQPNGLYIFDNPNLIDCEGLCNVINNSNVNGVIDVNNNGGYPCDDFVDWGVECALIALPVDLTTFSGYVMEGSNMLKWQTASEENTMVFLVERSLDGRRDFKEIGRLEAFGNSTSQRNYEMEDGNPVSLAYYRLRIVDFDGTFEFSDVIAVERSKTEIDLVEVYPIPAEDEITVLVHAKAAGKAIMTLSDFMGRKIKEEKIELKAGINRYNFNWEEHETNFYYLTIYNGNERIAKKILRASND